MQQVAPTFAVPFASNHTHANFDAGELHRYVSNPLELENFLRFKETNFEFKLMLPGSSWSAEKGFDLTGRSYFEEFERKHAEVKELQAGVIKKYMEREAHLRLGEAFASTLADFCSNSLRITEGLNLRFEVTSAGMLSEIYTQVGRTFVHDTYPCDGFDAAEEHMTIVIPNIVLKDAVIKNMFHHAGISKRVVFGFQRRAIRGTTQVRRSIRKARISG